MRAPKLTTDVFKRAECPIWAVCATVNKDGSAYYWSWYPKVHEKEGRWMAEDLYAWCQIRGTFDASAWKSSLLRRYEKSAPSRLLLRDAKGRFRKESKSYWLWPQTELSYSPSRGQLYYRESFMSKKWYEVAHPDEPSLDTVEDGTGEFTLLYPVANALIGRPIVSCRTAAFGMILYVDLAKNRLWISDDDFDMKPITKEWLLMNYTFPDGPSRYIAEVQLNK